VTATAAMTEDQLRYCERELSSCPKMFVRDGLTPFIHRRPYHEQMRKEIRSGYSVCCAYMSKNSANEDIVFRVLEATVQELLEPPTSWDFADNLAHVQVLILFQIIRLFDGNIRQRAMAEQQEAILDDWVDQLRQRTTSEAPLSWSPWQLWVFTKSVRRTVLCSFMLKGIYLAMKQGYCHVIGVLSQLRLSSQPALWGLAVKGPMADGHNEFGTFSCHI